jgi:hypothetical protein
MNTQKQKNNRRPKGVSFYIILAFLAIAIIFGAVFNIIADITERRLYPREYTEFVEKYSDAPIELSASTWISRLVPKF